MAARRASFASVWLLRSKVSSGLLMVGWTASGSLQDGQRLAKPGLSGFSSNSSEQMAQVLTGKGIAYLL